MNTISEHRKYLNEELLPKWASQFKPDQLVYDIGKSLTWDYKSFFKCKFLTVDRDESLKPDICIDLEHWVSFSMQPADGILFNGVFEQCNDPWGLMRNIKCIIKPYGSILAGLPSIGMPPYGYKDKWRLTEDGAREYMRDFGIKLFDKFPHYYYVIGVGR